MPPNHTPLSGYQEFPPAEMPERARQFADQMQRRRTLRDFVGVKRQIREAAEAEERELYEHRAPAADAKVPDISRMPLAEISTFVE